MPKVVTTVNLDYDEKMEFVRRYGKAELSEFLRKAIHEALEKNGEGLVDLSAIGRLVNNPMVIEANQSLEYWIEYTKKEESLEELIKMHPKTRFLDALVDGKIKGKQTMRLRIK